MREIIAALDLGTSKSIALVAQKDFSGKLSVIQTETIVSKNAIRRGRVYNSDETSEIISKLIGKLNDNPNIKVEKIYVGIGGQSLHTQELSIKREVESGTISQQLLDSIKEEALCYKPDFEDNLKISSFEYYADGHLVSTPKGIMASNIEVKYQLIVGNPCLKRNLKTVFNQKGIPVADYFISPLATAEAVLTPEEKESGCALIEFGEGVTYISIYKNKALKYLVTLPLGGLAITKDIRSLNVSEEEAEELKIKYGSAIPKQDDGESVDVNKDNNSSRKIELHYLNWIIEARVDEIIKNVWSLIEASGYSQEISAGIVITGGGALLRDLQQSIRNQTGKGVRLAKAKVLVNQVETFLSPSNSCVVGLASLGKENCVKENLILTPPNSPNEDDRQRKREEERQKEEERKRQRQEEEERKRKKEEERKKQKQKQGDPKIIKGVKRFLTGGLELFKDEDFEDTPPAKPIEKDDEASQPEDKNLENNKNEQ